MVKCFQILLPDDQGQGGFPGAAGHRHRGHTAQPRGGGARLHHTEDWRAAVVGPEVLGLATFFNLNAFERKISFDLEIFATGGGGRQFEIGSKNRFSFVI